MLRLISCLFLLLGSSLFPATADVLADLSGEPSGAISFMSITPRGPTELMEGSGTATAIAGALHVPSGTTAPGPAMVIMHGSGGILPGREGAWAQRLNEMGVATFIVDSFTPRGFAATGDDQSRLPLAASVADAFAALNLLATHPKVDPKKIGIMGFSKGGQLALYTALEPFRRSVAKDDLRFALHIAFYSSCSIPYLASRTTQAPIVFLLGQEDDFTPAEHCRRYAAFFESHGSPVSFQIFPNAHHGFDLPTDLRYLPRAQTARKCGLDIELEPRLMARRWDDNSSIPPSGISSYLRTCMERGASYGGNAAALASAIESVRSSVTHHLLARN
ncbi:dienelactone hydrolase family protein [Microvirga puerhi]|uniref:Dienelactone hydrolase family protein n=1 Tax=Microvirga puerhi TaxID=2876078 RepID=A0ABS7VNM2_9HYPH|nr:dienelactone hydrolase family protein [Microvirga puerhi]MBZ6076741.1 dienelactone hydrolase family protein [Microvirga puerhi]